MPVRGDIDAFKAGLDAMLEGHKSLSSKQLFIANQAITAYTYIDGAVIPSCVWIPFSFSTDKESEKLSVEERVASSIRHLLLAIAEHEHASEHLSSNVRQRYFDTSTKQLAKHLKLQPKQGTT